MQRRIVDFAGEQRGRGTTRAVPKRGTVKMRTHSEFAHAAARGEALQLVNPGRRLRHDTRDRQTAQCIECIALAPEVSIGQANATGDCVDKDLDGALGVAACDSDAAEATAGDAQGNCTKNCLHTMGYEWGL